MCAQYLIQQWSYSKFDFDLRSAIAKRKKSNSTHFYTIDTQLSSDMKCDWLHFAQTIRIPDEYTLSSSTIKSWHPPSQQKIQSPIITKDEEKKNNEEDNDIKQQSHDI